jgi:uncharacterized protein YoxC
MEAQLGTTNLLLGIMAAVSLFEAIALIAIGIAGWNFYHRVTTVLDELESRHVAPMMSRVNVILDDVRDVTSTVKGETYRVNQAIRSTVERVDDTAERVRSNVRVKTSRVIGFVRGVRVAIEAILRPAA